MSGLPVSARVTAIIFAAALTATAPALATPSDRAFRGQGVAQVGGPGKGISAARVWAKGADTDRDGLSNRAERQTRTNPRKADTDGEGLSDSVEIRKTKTNPRKVDTDGDGLTDWVEVYRTKTNPRKADSDGDGINDGVEIFGGTDPWSIPTPIDPTPSPPPPAPSPPPPGTPDEIPVKAIWSTPADARVGVPLTLDGSASTGGAPISCTWSFENETGGVVFQQRAGCTIDFTFEASGTKYVRLAVSDGAGGSDSSKQSFNVVQAPPPPPPPDTTAPDTTITANPPASTTSTSASFSFSSTESGSSFACSLDGGSFASCTSPKSYSGLALGGHSFAVRASDAAGNTDQTPASWSWTVQSSPPPPDTTAPDTTITANPPASTTSTSASFSFSSTESGSSFACSLDGGSFASCTSPKSYSGLALGGHSFAVRASDAAGNTDQTPASWSWTVQSSPPPPDTTAPDTTITANPPASTTSTSASFSFSSTESGSSFACSLDGGNFASCTSPKSYSGLALGGHSFAVRASDAAGNTDQTPASWSWTVQSSPPPPPPPPSGCVSGSTQATTAAEVRSAVQGNKDVCVTADVGNTNLEGLGSRDVTISSEGAGKLGSVNLKGTSDVTIQSARLRSVTLYSSDRTALLGNVIGGTQANRTYDQLIFAPAASADVRVEGNDIGWTLADNTGNTGYGCRCYGDIDNFRFVGNKVHDIAADGFQLGGGAENVLIDRNEIGPVGASPGSDEHSDNIQIVGNGDGLRITNNWIHHQGYFEGAVTGNAGSTYIHGGGGSLVYENNLIETARGRTEICGLGTGGTNRDDLTVRNNTWIDGGQNYSNFPSFEWDCDSGTNDIITRNIAVDPDGGLANNGFSSAIVAPNLWGQPSLVTLDAQGNCTSTNCNPAGQQPIGYRKPSGVSW